MKFYEKLRKARKENGMSQEELANQMNVSRQAVSKWESGQGYPETDKLLMISNIYGVSLDYLLKEESHSPDDETETGFYASRETVEGFLASKRKGARRIGIGVAVIILGLIFPMAMDSDMNSMMFLLTAAIGVVILLMQRFAPKRYEMLEQQPLVFDRTFLREFQTEYAQNRKKYGLLVIAGLLLIVMSLVFWTLMSNRLDSVGRTGAFVPVIWAAAVYLFIIAGSAFANGNVIANNEAHMAEVEKDKRYGWVWGAGMPLATMAFLAMGLIWNAWHPGWLVFPVAVFICLAIVGHYQAKR